VLKGIATEKQDGSPHSLQSLFVKKQWIFYGRVPFFRLPSDFQSPSYDVQGDQVTIGFRNGQILRFDIDRRSLQSILGFLPVTTEQAT
jgi:hypothetical protein